MDEILFSVRFAVAQIRGRNEHDIYRNYINDLPRGTVLELLNCMFDQIEAKDDSISTEFRKRGNEVYSKKIDLEESLKFYNDSLRHAVYNSEAYGITLANRSAIFFKMDNYESCINDIDWCLKAKYPNTLKSKVYARKAESFKKLGNALKMRETLLDLLNFMDETPSLPKSVTDKYRQIVQDLIIQPGDKKPTPQNRYDVLPSIEITNPTFSNASASVELHFNKRNGHRVVAKKDIKKGDVLFVEKAYAFTAVVYKDIGTHSFVHCQKCLREIIQFIPCKTCREHVYCSEVCRDSAWEDFHQWECVGVQTGLFKVFEESRFALRIILKGLQEGLAPTHVNFDNGSFDYHKADSWYPYVYSLPLNVQKVKDGLMNFAAAAAIMVQYLAMKTTFFELMKKLPAYTNKSEKELMNHVGGLIIRHCVHFTSSSIIMNSYTNIHSVHHQASSLTLCLSASRMGHSCMPNTAIYFIGNTVVVKAKQDIKTNEDICYAYLNVTADSNCSSGRKSLLENVCAVKCKCQACTDPRISDAFDAYFCKRCNGRAISDLDGMVNNKTCTCLDCNLKFMLSHTVFTQELFFFRYLTEFIEFNDIEFADMGLALCKAIYKPYHNRFLVLYMAISKYYFKKGEVLCFWQISKIIIDHVDTVFDNDFRNGWIRYASCKAVVDLLSEKTRLTNVRELRSILNEVTLTAKETRLIMELHNPVQLTQVDQLQKSLSKLRVQL